MAHTCHAMGCSRHCKPEFLMCLPHWRMVPYHLQMLVYRHYRPGQCDDMNPSKDWMLAAERAINAVAVSEEKMTDAEAEARLLLLQRKINNSERWFDEAKES